MEKVDFPFGVSVFVFETLKGKECIITNKEIKNETD